MWHRRKGDRSSNPEVQEAMDERDELMGETARAVQRVDRLQNELLRQYAEAETADRYK